MHLRIRIIKILKLKVSNHRGVWHKDQKEIHHVASVVDYIWMSIVMIPRFAKSVVRRSLLERLLEGGKVIGVINLSLLL